MFEYLKLKLIQIKSKKNENALILKTEIPKFTLKGLKVKALCNYVYDGDTIHIIFNYHGLKEFTCRFYGYNSAEVRTTNLEEKEKALESRNFVVSKLLGKILKVSILGEDKYGRLLIKVDYKNKDFSKLMIEKNYGKEYNGKGIKFF